MSRVISSTFLLKPKQTLQSNDSRNLLGKAPQFEIKFLAAIVHKLMVTQLHTVVNKQHWEQTDLGVKIQIGICW